MINQISAEDFKLSFWKEEKNQTELEKKVQSILNQVKENKDEALYKLTQETDKISLKSLKVPLEAMQKAAKKLSSPQKLALKLAAKNIRNYHGKIKPKSWKEETPELYWGQIFSPISKVGIYIPGGLTGYLSTVLMNCIPAQIAGAESIQVVSPPTKSGFPHSSILAALDFLGISEVFAVGGAQAIAALAYGTETISKVDLITGPGNQYVTEAKRQVFGTVGIDSIAGPSEIAILLDEKDDTPSEWIAADLVAQAEHGHNSKVLLVTHITEKAKKIAACVDSLVEKSKKKNILHKSIKNFGFVVVTKNLDESIKIINEVASEHLQIFSKNKSILAKIKNAGAIFWGSYSCVAMGDYVAGANHTLPTETTARFSSPLTVSSFMKNSSFIEYKKTGFQKQAPSAILLAELEGEVEHANSILYRLKKKT